MVPRDISSESSQWSQSRLKMWKNAHNREFLIEVVRQCILLPLTEHSIIFKAVDIVNRIIISVI